MTRPRTHRRRLALAAGVLAVVTTGAMAVYEALWREAPAATQPSDEAHFLFGSIGTERGGHGVPFWIWLVLPRVFPDLLPGAEGYWSLGVTALPGGEMPAGFSKVRVGVDRVGLTCAACHTARYRLRPDDPVTIVPGAPGHQAGIQQYQRFLAAAAADPRFTGATLLGEMAKNVQLGLFERLKYRFLLVPATRRALRARAPLNETGTGTGWGRGRADLLALLHDPRHGATTDSPGTADVMPLWSVANDSHPRFWDGSSRTLRDTVALSALSSGAAPAWVERDLASWDDTTIPRRSSLRRVADFMAAARPPRFPHPVDATLATAGSAVFAEACARCHTSAVSEAEPVIALGDIGTDRLRADAWRAERLAPLARTDVGARIPASLPRPTNGYRAVGLDGLWLRAPYLHNGSVPTLADLLAPPAERPRAFWRGYDLLDLERVGFVSAGQEAARVGTWFDTAEPGNGNGGHTHGTDLPAERKRALLEYLKTR